jgi:hypothetical protein
MENSNNYQYVEDQVDVGLNGDPNDMATDEDAIERKKVKLFYSVSFIP